MPPSPESPPDTCDQCGKEIPPWAPAGNCPSCLLGGNSSPAGPAPEAEVDSAKEKIGDWTLLERIGEGAFGVVFAARQNRPVERTAAVKILRPGMASKEMLARFQAESQALAMMNHPDVVTIYDADTSEDGRPWFAMEYVPGKPITEFAENLSLGEKLTLFDRVCAVVEHAHRHGIIHRDLKPANVLVYQDEKEDAPVVKLLDFGIAKATEHVLTDATILTQKDHFLGTPEYTSPEQAEGGDIDTRSDVYSLGVILYELLAGRPPFVLSSSSLEEVLAFLQRVRDEIPAPPSSHLETVLPQDLDWIAGKAIEKDRSRRYDSVGDLREDLARYRENRPIEARPPDTFYLARKFLHRHRKAAAAISAITASLVAAVVVSSFMAIRASQASRETRLAYSQSDLRTGVEALDRLEISRSIAYLVRALRTDPGNREATMLLRSTVEQYPPSRLLQEVDHTDGFVQVAEFLDDKGASIVVSERGTTLVLDPSGREVAPPLEFGGTNQKGSLSPDRKWLALTNIQGDLALIDTSSGESLPLERPEDFLYTRVRAVKFSPSGKILVMAFAEAGLVAWDCGTRKLLWSVKLPAFPVSMVFYRQGEGVSVAGHDGKRYDYVTATGESSDSVPQQPESITDLVISGSGFRFYTVSRDGIISACDAGRPPRSFTAERIEVPLLLSISDPKRRLVAYLAEGEVSVWTVQGLTIIRRLPLPDPPTAVALDSPSGRLYVGTSESGIIPWNFDTNQFFGSEISLAKNAIRILVDPAKERLWCHTRDGLFQTYRIPGPPEAKGPGRGLREDWAAIDFEDRAAGFLAAGWIDLEKIPVVPGVQLRAVSALPDGSVVAGAYRDGFVRLWNPASGELLEKIETSTTSVRSVDLSPDGRLLAYRDHFSHIVIHDLDTGESKSLRTPSGRDSSSIAFSPDGATIAVATDGGKIYFYDTRTAEELRPPVSHDTRGNIEPHYCRFSRDGATLATWSASDRAFRLWEAGSGTPLGSPLVGEGVPKYAFFTENDDYLLTVTEKAEKLFASRIWSLPSLVPITPERPFDPERFDFSRIEIPSDQALSPRDLDRIEIHNGLSLGENGFREVTSPARSSASPDDPSPES